MLAKPKVRHAADATPARPKRPRATKTGAAKAGRDAILASMIGARPGRHQAEADIARDIRTAIGERLGHITDMIEVRVRDGVVTLGGDLESGNQKTIVEETVDRLAGHCSVVNLIRITSPSKLGMRTLYR